MTEHKLRERQRVSMTRRITAPIRQGEIGPRQTSIIRAAK